MRVFLSWPDVAGKISTGLIAKVRIWCLPANSGQLEIEVCGRWVNWEVKRRLSQWQGRGAASPQRGPAVSALAAGGQAAPGALLPPLPRLQGWG